MLYQFQVPDFNTSHVTVYHPHIALLNVHPFISIHLMLLFIQDLLLSLLNIIEFQYISCYCLSAKTRIMMHLIDFNTSHVTVYQWLQLRLNTKLIDFNTSHVTVYQQQRLCYWCICFISIHLMLLFIYLQDYNSDMSKIFQYISCYCLSSSSK